jgi:AraC-like DNA-binding protein
VNLDCRIEQHGACPPGTRTFVIPADETVSYLWRNHQIEPNTLQLFPRNGELFSISNSSFHCNVISFPEQMFLLVLEQLGYDKHASTWNDAFVWKETNAFISRLQKICCDYQSGWIDDDHSLLTLLVESLVHSSGIKSQFNPRLRIVKSALEYLEKKHFDIEGLGELVDKTGYSERSLQYAFKAIYGVSPMNYIKRSKLNQICKQLLENPEYSITDMANLNGFWHMGQFARDFRSVYGRLPSDIRKSSLMEGY